MSGEDWEDLQRWHDCDRLCPDCGSPTRHGTWWDDHPDHGGAAIGDLWECTNDECGWADWQ